jgi:hypothetical protein
VKSLDFTVAVRGLSEKKPISPKYWSCFKSLMYVYVFLCRTVTNPVTIKYIVPPVSPSTIILSSTVKVIFLNYLVISLRKSISKFLNTLMFFNILPFRNARIFISRFLLSTENTSS